MNKIGKCEVLIEHFNNSKPVLSYFNPMMVYQKPNGSYFINIKGKRYDVFKLNGSFNCRIDS